MPLPLTPADQKLADELLGHSIDLLRLDAHIREQVMGLFDKMQAELTAKMDAATLSEYNKAKIDFLLNNAKVVLDNYYAQVHTLLNAAVTEIPALQGAVVAKAMVDVGLGASLPTASHIQALLSDLTIQGAPAQAWWKKQAADTLFKFAATVRMGVIQGDTNQQIIARVIGNPRTGEIGVLDVSRSNAAALVQTSVQSVANQSRLDVFEQNADLIKELEWFTALDGHVCPMCIARFGLRWTNNANGDHAAIDHSIPFSPPPIHFNDRCILLPITRGYGDLGLNVTLPKNQQRASMDGPVSVKTTFDDFLKRKGIAFQNEVLGAGKAQMWRAGKLKLSQLVDMQGNSLSLAELQSKYL